MPWAGKSVTYVGPALLDILQNLWGRARRFTPVAHTLALAIYVPLLLYVPNTDDVELAAFVRAMAVMMFVAIVLIAVLRLAMNDLGRPSVVVSILLLSPAIKHLVLGLSYSPMLSAVVCRHLSWFVDIVALCLAAYTAFRISARGVANARNALTSVAVGLLTVNLAFLGIEMWQARSAHWDATVSRIHDAATAMPLNPKSQPDIYYIVVDSYPRADTMKRLYGVEHQPLLDFLRAEGFFVANDARSNYPWTLQSVASSLNMSYLSDVGSAMLESDDRRPLRALIQNSAAMRVLRDQGYHTKWIASDYSATAATPFADSNACARRRLTGFELRLLSATPFRQTAYQWHRDQLECQIAQLQEVPVSGNRPQFVFAHIMAPHPPFVYAVDGCDFQSTGHFTFSAACSMGNYPEDFRGQAAAVAVRVQQAIRTILDQSQETPIIIVQADHGPGSRLANDVDHTDLGERFGILSAYLLPNSDDRWMHDHLSPVNNFRIIFNEYFGGEFEILPDRSFFAPVNDLYAFVDVTDRLNDTQRAD